MNKFLNLYYKFYDWQTGDRVEKGELQSWQVHTFNASVFSTSLLMWAYAFTAYYYISDPTPGIVGFICSVIHFLSPLSIKVSRYMMFNLFFMLGPGMIHQGTYSFYTGGLMSNIIIWFGVLPMLAGIVVGKAGAATWFIITLLVNLYFTYLKLSGVDLPILISEEGLFVSQLLIAFGFISLSGGLIWVFNLLMEKNEQQLRGKNEKIKNLIRVLSHDISNPLSLIKNRSEMLKRSLLKEGQMDAYTEKQINQLQRGSRGIQDIIDNIREVNAIESGKRSIELKKVVLNETIDYVCFLFSDSLERKKIEIQYDFEKNKNFAVLADHTGLRNQVLSNIISNSIKFSDEGSKITIDLEEIEDGYLRIIIKDQGIGIPPQILEKLFELDSKTSRVGTSGEKGTGFGMPIVKTYVEKFGGRLSVVSQERAPDCVQGYTQFSIELPIA